MNFLVWQALHRAILAAEADGLTVHKRARLAAGWEDVKQRCAVGARPTA